MSTAVDTLCTYSSLNSNLITLIRAHHSDHLSPDTEHKSEKQFSLPAQYHPPPPPLHCLSLSGAWLPSLEWSVVSWEVRGCGAGWGVPGGRR